MKTHRLLLGLLSLLAASCTVKEIVDTDRLAIEPVQKVYRAVIDDSDDDASATRAFADDQLRVLWNADDRITMFEQNTYGRQYRFTGEDGANQGDFVYVGAAPGTYGTGGDIDKVYAIYPYQAETSISYDEAISYTLPAVQTYRENSFGRGANVMLAVTDEIGGLLKFKNACGYLMFRLYGENVSVASVYLDANDGTSLAGPCSIVWSSEGVPALTMASANTVSRVRVSCPEPVELAASASDYTEFWFALPPVPLHDFTLTVATPDNKVFTKEVHLDLELKRNTVKKMPALKVTPVTSTENIGLNGVSSSKNHKVDVDGSTFTITLPTVTDFSALELDYDFDGTALYAGEVPVANGTPIDASDDVTLKVLGTYAEKHYTLKAQNTGLPVVRITTDGFTLEELESYLNSLQSSDGLDHREWMGDGTNTSVRIEYPDGTPGMGDQYEALTEIKGRGNYTWTWEKKPYALKLKSKSPVLGMPSHKRWILLANWRDRTLLRNEAAFWLSSHSGLPYTVRGQFVELEINGEHRGNYYLCEQIKIDKNRVNITALDKDFEDLSGGYLMEIDSYWDEVNKFKSAEFNLKYMFKEPDEDPNDEATDPGYAAGYAWMQNHIAEFEKVLKTRSGVANKLYEQYLDVDSAIMFMLLNELTGNRDFFQGANIESVFGPHSTYLYKDKGGKIFMGPIWDFDYETFIPATYYPNRRFAWRGYDNTGYYYYYLSANQDFVNQIKNLWTSKKDGFQGLVSHIAEMAQQISLSQQFDEEMWPYNPNLSSQEHRKNNHDYELSFPAAIERMQTSFQARFDWMDSQISALKVTSPRFKY